VFSVTFRYALISLLEIAAAEVGLRASTIAERHNLSVRYLANVLTDLKRLGLVTSQKGPNGGYVLCKTPAAINLLALHQGLAGSGRTPAAVNGDGGTAQEAGAKAGGSLAADRWLAAVEDRWHRELANTSLDDIKELALERP
jgi:Rrf2 family protein